jgi:sugar fermentation stimulation protein A
VAKSALHQRETVVVLHRAPPSLAIHMESTPRFRVELPGPLVPARFVERPNRFLLRVRVEGHEGVQEAHLPDPGRLRELLVPGAPVWVRPASGGARRTRWTAVVVRSPDGRELISMDTTLPNRLVGRALEGNGLPEFGGFRMEAREWAHGRSRFDFLLLDDSGRRLVLEVKSVTLVEGDRALFPDAVTTRGARHVRELSEFAAREGWNAAVLFVLQRSDALSITAAREIDPDFAEALAEAREAGVRILGRRCHVSLDGVTLGDPIPVT